MSIINEKDILLRASKKANDYFFHFISIMNLDTSIFSYIKNIQLRIGNVTYHAWAEYDINNNIIIVDKAFLKSCINELKLKPMYISRIVDLVARTIVHEMVHSTRVILVNNGLYYLNVQEKMDVLNNSLKHDFFKYRMLLSDMFRDNLALDLDVYVPISLKEHKDGSYTVLTYNRKTKDYDIFEKQFFKTKTTDDLKDSYKHKIKKIEPGDELRMILHSIGKELNDTTQNHQVSKIIMSDININSKAIEKNTLLLASSYYHPYSEKDSFYGVKSAKDIKKLRDDVFDHLNYAEDFEECITETMADLMYYSRNDDFFDFDKVSKVISDMSMVETYVKLSLYLIKKVGIDFITSFLMSSSHEMVGDYLENVFGEEYDKLLLNFSEIYNNETAGLPVKQEFINNVYNIINKKTEVKKM